MSDKDSVWIGVFKVRVDTLISAVFDAVQSESVDDGEFSVRHAEMLRQASEMAMSRARKFIGPIFAPCGEQK